MEIAEKNTKMTVQAAKATADFIKKFFESFLKWLEAKDLNRAQEGLYKYLKKGGEACTYRVKIEYAEEFKRQLKKEGIGFFNTNSESAVIVGQDDLPKIQKIYHDILMAHCNYYQVVDADKMEDVIAKNPQASKELLTIGNLDKYELEALKNNSQNISQGFLIGVRQNPENPENSDFVLRSEYVSSEEHRDFCLAYLEANMDLYGSNEDIRREQIDADEKFETEDIPQIKESDETVYIVGSNTKRTGIYIEMTPNGFELYCQGNSMASVSKEDPDYDYELQKAIDRIHNKGILKDMKDLEEFLETGTCKAYRTYRPVRTKEQNIIDGAEEDICVKIDEMVDGLIAKQGLTFDDSKEMFEFYVDQASDILVAVAMGDYVEGYSPDDFEVIQTIAAQTNVDLDKMTKVAQKMCEKPIEKSKAKENKKKSKEKEM